VAGDGRDVIVSEKVRITKKYFFYKKKFSNFVKHPSAATIMKNTSQGKKVTEKNQVIWFRVTFSKSVQAWRF